MFTIDTSVWVNAYSPAEAGHAASRSFLDALFSTTHPVFVPTLLPVELAGAIARVRGDSQLATGIARAMFQLSTIRWVALNDEVAQRALQIAADHRLRGADAIYAAVALAHNCELVSLDQEHLTRLTTVVRTSTPADAIQRLQPSA